MLPCYPSKSTPMGGPRKCGGINIDITTSSNADVLRGFVGGMTSARCPPIVPSRMSPIDEFYPPISLRDTILSGWYSNTES